MKKHWRVAAFAAALVVADATSAATFFGGSWALKASNKSDPGLIMVTDKAFGSFSKSLDVGQSFEISVLKLWTNEREVNGDDKVKKPFSVAFNCPLNLLSVLFMERRNGPWDEDRQRWSRGHGMPIPSWRRAG
jgi:hypothetical protein